MISNRWSCLLFGSYRFVSKKRQVHATPRPSSERRGISLLHNDSKTAIWNDPRWDLGRKTFVGRGVRGRLSQKNGLRQDAKRRLPSRVATLWRRQGKCQADRLPQSAPFRPQLARGFHICRVGEGSSETSRTPRQEARDC